MGVRFSNDRFRRKPSARRSADGQHDAVGDGQLETGQLLQQLHVSLERSCCGIELDALPAFFRWSASGPQPRGKLTGTDDYVKTGIMIQRIWLTAAEQGCSCSPK